VFLSNSRGPETLYDLARKLGPNAHARTVDHAVEASDLVIVAIPLDRYETLPAARIAHRTVIDATNYIPHRDISIAEELVGIRVPGQLLQRHLAGATVVKAFSNIYSGHLHALARPLGATDRSALPLAGDGETAKQQVAELLNEIGWDFVDTGPLTESARFDVGTPVFVRPYLADPSGSDTEWGARMTTDPGKPLNTTQVQDLLDKA
jgi:predicted dinucleotide-binding enzyme